MNPHKFFVGRVVGVLVILAIAGVWYLAKPHAAPPASALTPVATVSYACNGGKVITAAYYKGETKPAPAPGEPPIPTGSVALTLSDGRTMTLQQTISGSGIRYANADESFVFWSKGNGALVLENNQEKSYIGCVAVAPEPAGQSLPQVYVNGTEGFSIRLPDGYTADDTYRYQELGPGKDIAGVKFTVPESVSTGTNLSSDTYLSVEEIPALAECTADRFLWQDGVRAQSISENGTEYSVASTTGAAAGNRYDETVYAISGTNPCIAVRYFIHYGVFENYPPGTVREFDEQALRTEFDAIRHTLTIAP